eukprot:gene22591-29730_t
MPWWPPATTRPGTPHVAPESAWHQPLGQPPPARAPAQNPAGSLPELAHRTTSPPHYLVIGQQRSGTSTLWALAHSHPRLREGISAGRSKEPSYFQMPILPSPHTTGPKPAYNKYGTLMEYCDRSPKEYLDLWDNLPNGTLVLHTIVPNAKVIVILRDPVQRSLSRFVEQYKWPFPEVGMVEQIATQYSSFESYADAEMKELQACLDAPASLPKYDYMNASGFEELVRHRCMTASNIVGWSAYSVFLKRWLEFYSKDQLLVLYTSELENDPAGTMSRLDSHLGIECLGKSTTVDQQSLLHIRPLLCIPGNRWEGLEVETVESAVPGAITGRCCVIPGNRWLNVSRQVDDS